jgi:hypothetical protein
VAPRQRSCRPSTWSRSPHLQSASVPPLPSPPRLEIGSLSPQPGVGSEFWGRVSDAQGAPRGAATSAMGLDARWRGSRVRPLSSGSRSQLTGRGPIETKPPPSLTGDRTSLRREPSIDEFSAIPSAPLRAIAPQKRVATHRTRSFPGRSRPPFNLAHASRGRAQRRGVHTAPNQTAPVGPTASSRGHIVREGRDHLERAAPRGLKEKTSGLSTLADVIRIESDSGTADKAPWYE